jgi:hypothetical protein
MPKKKKGSSGNYSSLDKSTDIVPDTECSICLEEITDETRKTLEPCNHSFHNDCINEWAKSSDSCPLCRGPINTLDLPSPVPQITPQRMAVIRRGISRITRNPYVRGFERAACVIGTGAALGTGCYAIGAEGLIPCVEHTAPADAPVCGAIGGVGGSCGACIMQEPGDCRNCCTETCDSTCGEGGIETVHDTTLHDMERGGRAALKNKYKKGKRYKSKSKRRKSKRRKSKRRKSKNKKRKSKKKSKC